MARPGIAAAYELPEENLISVPFPYPKKLPPGSKVFVHCSLDNGPWTDYELAFNGIQFEGTIEMPENTHFKYKFKIIRSDSTETEWDPSGFKNDILGIAKAAPEPSPSPTTGVKEVRANLKRSVANILEAARSGDEAQGLEALFDQLRTQMDIMGIRDNQTLLILELAVEVIREIKTFPSAIRTQFPEKQAIPSFAEFQRRMEAGSRNYRRQVFNALRADKSAREKFGLDTKGPYNPRSPLGNDEFDRIFDRLCSEKDLSALAPRLGVAIESVANVPSRNARLDAQRQRLLDDVMAQLTPKERNEPLKPSKRAKVQEGAVQAALVGLGFISLPAATVAWIAKGLIEGTAGAHVSDIGTMKPEELGKRFLKNNFVRRWLKTDETLGDITKKGIFDWLKRSIPIFGAKYAGEDLAEEKPETAETGYPEALIRSACDKAAA